jgi:hypothetical protein
MANSSMFGRVYKMNWRGRAFPLSALLIGAFGLVGISTGVFPLANYRDIRFVISCVLSLVFGAISTPITFTAKITLLDDAIELRDVLHTRRLLISEIRGRQEIVHAGSKGITSTWKLVPKDDRARTLALSNSYTFDDVFYEWLNQIPVLDAEDVN